MSFQRLGERTAEGLVILVDGNSGDDHTLYEGSCVEGEAGSGVEGLACGKINCAECLRIIWHCKGIPARHLALGRAFFEVPTEP